MITLAFAHFTFSVSFYDVSLLDKTLDLKTGISVKNEKEKFSFLKEDDLEHTLHLTDYGVEVNCYKSTQRATRQQMSELDKLLKAYKSDRQTKYLNLNEQVLNFLAAIAFIKSDHENSIRIKRSAFLPGVTLVKRSEQLTTCNPFLDDFGLSSIAFYVSDFIEFDSIESHINIEKICKPYNVRVAEKQFGIQFIRIGGVTFELIRRI